jgi:hypothetical protein
MEACYLPKEIWQLIVTELGPWDALQLRTVSKNFYQAVTSFQSYWYRQFCWYLICQKKRPAMFKTGCQRKHNQPYSIACLNVQQEMQLSSHLNIKVSDLPDYISKCPNIVEPSNCTNSSHYIYEIPDNRLLIPLDPTDYKPNEQNYLYRFLIHNYRQQRQRASRYDKSEIKLQLRQVQDDLTKQQKEFDRIVEQYKRDIQKTKNRQKFLKGVYHQLETLDRNKVFHGQRSRTYKSSVE